MSISLKMNEIVKLEFELTYYEPSQLGLQKTPTAFLQKGKTSPSSNKCHRYDTKKSNGEASEMLGL